MFTAALFTTAKTWKQPKCSLTDEGINKVWYINTGILLSHKKKWNNTIYSIMDGLRDYHSKSVRGAFPGGSVVKNPTAKQEMQVQTLGGKIPWRRKWQPIPVFLPGKSHGQRSYSPWGCKRVRHNLVTNQQKQQSQIEKDKYQMISLKSGI